MPLSIDAHHHLWDVGRGDYHWMPDDGPLRRSYLLEELDEMLAATGVDRTVVVQAAATVEESRFLFSLAARDPRIAGVVGWVDLDRPEEAIDADLDALLEAGPLVGVRPSMFEYLRDASWLARPRVQHGLERLAARGLAFDLVCQEEQLPVVAPALAAHQELRVCVDHLAKPSYARVSSRWFDGMRTLAELPQAYCKVSGMVTEVSQPWAAADFRRHVEAVAQLFGSSRLMYGSDWPACRLAGEAEEVHALAAALTSDLSAADQARFWGGAAVECYRLRSPV